MQDTLLEQILYKPISKKHIDQYLTGTIALFTPDPPKPFTPFCGPWAPSLSAQKENYIRKEIEQGRINVPERPIDPLEQFIPKSHDPLGLSIGKGSTKFFGPETDNPLMRIDRKQHHGLPENHLQFGNNFTGRFGDEAYDIYAEVFKNTRREIVFPFDEKKKNPWDY